MVNHGDLWWLIIVIPGNQEWLTPSKDHSDCIGCGLPTWEEFHQTPRSQETPGSSSAWNEEPDLQFFKISNLGSESAATSPPLVDVLHAKCRLLLSFYPSCLRASLTWWPPPKWWDPQSWWKIMAFEDAWGRPMHIEPHAKLQHQETDHRRNNPLVTRLQLTSAALQTRAQGPQNLCEAMIHQGSGKLEHTHIHTRTGYNGCKHQGNQSGICRSVNTHEHSHLHEVARKCVAKGFNCLIVDFKRPSW